MSTRLPKRRNSAVSNLSHIAYACAIVTNKPRDSWNPAGATLCGQGAQEAIMAMETPAKSTEKKPAGAKAPAKAGGAGLQKPVQPSKELAAIVGDAPLPRTEVISK